MITGHAPDFELPGVDGGVQRLAELQGNGTLVLVFFKTNCPTCQYTFPFLERLQKAASAESAKIVAISQDDAAATRCFRSRFGISIPTLLDAAERRYAVSNAYQITDVPSLFLIAPGAQILRSSSGFDKAALEDLASLFRVPIFAPTERVPVFRPG